jgi:hypothetical protein
LAQAPKFPKPQSQSSVRCILLWPPSCPAPLLQAAGGCPLCIGGSGGGRGRSWLRLLVRRWEGSGLHGGLLLLRVVVCRWRSMGLPPPPAGQMLLCQLQGRGACSVPCLVAPAAMPRDVLAGRARQLSGDTWTST